MACIGLHIGTSLPFLGKEQSFQFLSYTSLSMLTSTNNSIENGPNDAQTAAPTKADLSIDSQFICVSCSFQGNITAARRTGRMPENRENTGE